MKWNELTTLCYIERGDSYLMMHRTKKENDINKDKYVGVGGHFEGDLVWAKKSDVYNLNLWEGDRIFFRLMEGSRIVR